jgi:hypothetical protein
MLGRMSMLGGGADLVASLVLMIMRHLARVSAQVSEQRRHVELPL